MVPFMFEVENDIYALYHIWITLKDLWEEFLIYGTNHLHIHQITVKIFTSPYFFFNTFQSHSAKSHAAQAPQKGL